MLKDQAELDYLRELEDMLDEDDTIYDEFYESPTTADGCSVEPDGKCEHGYSSPLLLLNLI